MDRSSKSMWGPHSPTMLIFITYFNNFLNLTRADLFGGGGAHSDFGQANQIMCYFINKVSGGGGGEGGKRGGIGVTLGSN